MATGQKNIYGIVFFVLFSIFVFETIIFFEMVPKKCTQSFLTSSSFHIVRGFTSLILFCLLGATLVLYARKENKIRILIWRNSEKALFKNIYATRLIVLVPALVLGGFLLGWGSPRIFTQGIPYSLNLIATSTLLLGIVVLLPATIISYSYEEDRITEAMYVKFAREFGCDESVVNKLKFGKRKWPGIWAEITVNYKGQDILFCGEDTERPTFPCFLVAIERKDKPKCSEIDLVRQMKPETKAIFEDIQNQVKYIELSCDKHKLFFRIPMIYRFRFNAKISINFLQKAVDILLSMP
ncbi:MAG: hypothetical protein ACYSWZ_14375 [Planctomycetota bacterium]|jgi:hypothetical protein